MDVRGSHGHAPVPDHGAIELRSRGGPSTSAAGAVSPTEAARHEEIGRIADKLEKASAGGSQVREYMREIAAVLHNEMGQSADDVQDVLNKARKYDYKTSALAESAIGLAYGLSGVPGDLAGKALASKLHLQPGTQAHDFVTGLAGGLTAVGFKAVVSKLVGNSLKEGKWMQADKDNLQPFMQEMMKKHSTTGHEVKQAGVGGAPYTGRNPVTGAISTLTQRLPENAPRAQPMGISEGVRQGGYWINQGAGVVLTTAAGAGSGALQNATDHLHGAEYLFGRTDWKERYAALSGGTKQHSAAGGRFDALMTNAKTPKNWLNAMRNLIALSQLAEGFALGGGLGLANMAKTGARNSIASSMAKGLGTVTDVMKNPTNRAIRELVGQGAYIPVAAGAYFSQGLAAIAYSHLKQSVKERLGLTDGSSSPGSSTNTDTTDEDVRVSSGARTPEGEPAESQAPSVGVRRETPAQASEVEEHRESPAQKSDVDARNNTPAQASEVDEHRESPAQTSEVDARNNTPVQTSDVEEHRDSPAQTSEVDARRAASPAASGSESASVRSHYSGSLQNTPPERTQAMRAEGDTHVWWSDFPDTSHIQSPRPQRITPEDAAAIIAHIEAEAEQMSARIEQMIPDVGAESASSTSSVSNEPAAATLPKAPAEPKKEA